MWIHVVTVKCLGMIGGTSISLACGRNRPGRRGWLRDGKGVKREGEDREGTFFDHHWMPF